MSEGPCSLLLCYYVAAMGAYLGDFSEVGLAVAGMVCEVLLCNKQMLLKCACI